MTQDERDVFVKGVLDGCQIQPRFGISDLIEIRPIILVPRSSLDMEKLEMMIDCTWSKKVTVLVE